MFDPNKCAFCQKEIQPVVMENEIFWAKFDPNPVTKGHSLIVLNDHGKTFFDLNEKEIEKCFELIGKMKEKINSEFHADGYNIGVNIGKAAGSTIDHLHIHLIPRYEGDTEDPRGGIRNILGKNIPLPPKKEDFIEKANDKN